MVLSSVRLWAVAGGAALALLVGCNSDDGGQTSPGSSISSAESTAPGTTVIPIEVPSAIPQSLQVGWTLDSLVPASPTGVYQPGDELPITMVCILDPSAAPYRETSIVITPPGGTPVEVIETPPESMAFTAVWPIPNDAPAGVYAVEGRCLPLPSQPLTEAERVRMQASFTVEHPG